MPVQRGKIERFFADDGRHPGAAFGPRNCDSVDAGMPYTLESAEHLRHLGGRHGLALAAEGGADAVHKVEEALLVLAHHVAGPYPGVTRYEDVAQDFFLGLDHTAVALESASRARRIVLHLADRLARLVDAAADTEAFLVPDRLAA